MVQTELASKRLCPVTGFHLGGDSILPLVVAKLPPRGKQAQIQTTVLPISPTPLAKLGPAAILQPLVAKLPWTHNIILMEKVKDISVRGWYMKATLQEGWSSDVLALMIDSRTHERQGKAITNFSDRLPPIQSDLARQVLKDPFIFDFTTLEEPFHERELETSLVRHLEKFLVELGQGFAFVCRLKDGRVLVVEFKGGDSDKGWYALPESEEKRLVGAIWAKRSNGRCLFIMPKGKDFAAIRALVTG